MFRDRDDAGQQLAERLQGRAWHQPIVLGIPRGGVVIAAVLARNLHADLDVILSRKLRAPGQPELALGAVSETGEVYLDHPEARATDWIKDYLKEEVQEQLIEIERRKELFRSVLPHATLRDRSVVLTDDGLATGSTMMAAVKVVRAQKPREIIVAVPVASPDRLAEVRQLCDETFCVLTPRHFQAIGQFYQDFSQVSDDEVLDLLRSFAPSP